MTKLISILIIIVVLFIGYHLFEYWTTVKNDENSNKSMPSQVVIGDQLPGLPWQLQNSLSAAQNLKTAAALRDWLKAYGDKVQDPRKAWIQLDYCLLVQREDVSEAKRVFAEVKQRTPESSPVWPRIKELEKTYQ
jgi:hypothetical protein